MALNLLHMFAIGWFESYHSFTFANPGDGFRATLPHWRGMVTVGEVVVHLFFAHDIGLLLVALSDGVVLAVGLGEPKGNQFLAGWRMDEVLLKRIST